MTKKIACVSTKGGVGKSTLATTTGTYSACSGSRTLVADLATTVGTCKDWADRRATRSVSIVIDVALYESVTVALEQRYFYDLIVFDVGPGSKSDEARIQAALLSDLVIVPVNENALDLQGSIRFAEELILDGVEKDRIFFVVYGHCDFRGAEEARAIVCSTGFNCACTSIPWLTGYSTALNKGLSLIETTHPSLNDRAARLAAEIMKALSSRGKLV